jgi:pteridine reductase
LIRKNLQDKNDCEQLIDTAWRAFGKLDVLINNAAVFCRKSFFKTNAEDIQTQLRINYFVPVWLTETFVSFLKQQRKSEAEQDFIPKIINMLDCKIKCPFSSFPAYIVSKAMLAEFTIHSARLLAPYVLVNGIAPGPVLPPVPSDDFSSSIYVPAGKILTKSRASVDDIVKAVIYLMKSKVITGQIIYVDSGQHLSCI